MTPTQESLEGSPDDFPESVFTHFLIRGLSGDPGAVDAGTKSITFDSLMEYLRGNVSNYARSHFNETQTPDGRATLGRMVLATVSEVPSPIQKPPLTPEQQQQANDRLARLWTDADGTWNQAKVDALTVAAVQGALDGGADINVRGKDGDTVLMVAAGFGNADVVRMLLDRGADVNTKNENNWTPLMWASLKGYPQIVRLLLDSGADAAIQNHDGVTALSLARSSHQDDVVAMLKAAGTKPPLTPEQQQEANVRLLALWTDPDGSVNDGKARAMTVTAVEQALDQGADINSKDRVIGDTALTKAAWFGNIEVVRLLLDRGADVNAINNDISHYGDTALFKAVYSGRTDLVRLLLARGADVNAKNSMGETPLSWARLFHHDDVAAILRTAGAKE